MRLAYHILSFYVVTALVLSDASSALGQTEKDPLA